jgi:two-component system, cell cycle response regulator DivK
VDDFQPNRDLYAHVLSAQGFRVALAANGQEALDQAFLVRPDLIIMDLSLPVISGPEACRQLKADERTRRIPIVIITAYDVPDGAAMLGCEAVLTKPCLPDVILAEISRALGGQEARDAADQ